MKSLELKVTGYLNASSFHGKEYETKFSGLGLNFKVGDLEFVKVSHDHPESNEVLYQVNVPKCLDQSNNPIEGWEKLPVDSCN